MWKRLLAQLFGKETSAISYGTLSYIELQKLLPMKKINSTTIYLTHPDNHMGDFNYKLPTIEQIQQFLQADDTNWFKYKNEEFDCDDFAVVLHGRAKEKFGNFAFGFAKTDLHAFNFFIDDKKELYVVEPQEDKIIKYNKNNPNARYFPFKMVLI